MRSEKQLDKWISKGHSYQDQAAALPRLARVKGF